MVLEILNTATGKKNTLIKMFQQNKKSLGTKQKKKYIKKLLLSCYSCLQPVLLAVSRTKHTNVMNSYTHPMFNELQEQVYLTVYDNFTTFFPL